MESWSVVLIMMAAFVGGIATVVLLQVRATLRTLQERVGTLSDALEPAVENYRVVARRARLVSDGLDGREADLGHGLVQLVEQAQELAAILQRFKGTAQVAGAVGTAVAAGIRAMREQQSRHEPKERDAGIAEGAGHGESTMVGRPENLANAA